MYEYFEEKKLLGENQTCRSENNSKMFLKELWSCGLHWCDPALVSSGRPLWTYFRIPYARKHWYLQPHQ